MSRAQSPIARLAALAMSFVWGVIGGCVGLNGLIKGNQAKSHLRHALPPTISVDINTNDVFKTGAVITTVCALVALLSLIFLLPLPARRAQAGMLAFCAVWLFATLIPYDVFFARRAAQVSASIGGVPLQPAAVAQAQAALGATSVYRHLSYLRLVAILPWFTLLFAAIAAGVLFVEPSPRAEYTESEEPTREMDEMDEKDEKKLVV